MVSLGGTALIAAGPGTPARGATPSSLTLVGHGWGHGVGMGQWGALGYALNGQSYGWILVHYYGGTSAAGVPDRDIRVRLVENDGNDITVTSASSFTAAGVSVAAGQAALMHFTGSGGQWTVSTGPGCTGPWQPATTAADATAPGTGAPPAVVSPSTTDPGASAGQLLQLCRGSGNLYLRGLLEAAEISGSARTVNVLPLESYLEGVVPSESPSYWGGLGGAGVQGEPMGFQALEAQAVAARSYAVAAQNQPDAQGGTGEYGYADICDTTACQVYGGQKAETRVADLAVTDTVGQVRDDSAGHPVPTEFSSSTGGWTAGGPFPSVVDDGDAVCVSGACNPNHNWSATVPVASIQSAYPTIGTFSGLSVTSRSGPPQADQGGRVGQLTVTGGSGSVTTTGASFAARLGLKSSWFEVQGSPSGGMDGYWVGASDGGIFSFGAATFHGSTGNMRLNQPMVGMTATPDGAGYWIVARDGGIFTFGDAGFYGSTGAIRLNRPIVGMAPTRDGRGYWLVASDGGIFTFGDAGFYGSTANLTLDQPIVGMAASPDGRGYWMVARDGGIFTFGDSHFYGSTAVKGPVITAMAPAQDGAGYWLLGATGTVYPFGDAASFGSARVPAGDQAVDIQGTETSQGYLILSGAGNVFSLGDAPDYGGVSSQSPAYAGHALSIAGVVGG